MILGYQSTWKLLVHACRAELRAIKRGPFPLTRRHKVIGSWPHCWLAVPDLHLWPSPNALRAGKTLVPIRVPIVVGIELLGFRRVGATANKLVAEAVRPAKCCAQG